MMYFPWMSLVSTLVWAGVIGFGIYMAFRNNWSGDHHRNPSHPDNEDDTTKSALTILNEAYARGDLSEDDYLKRKHNILSKD